MYRSFRFYCKPFIEFHIAHFPVWLKLLLPFQHSLIPFLLLLYIIPTMSTTLINYEIFFYLLLISINFIGVFENFKYFEVLQAQTLCKLSLNSTAVLAFDCRLYWLHFDEGGPWCDCREKLSHGWKIYFDQDVKNQMGKKGERCSLHSCSCSSYSSMCQLIWNNKRI